MEEDPDDSTSDEDLSADEDLSVGQETPIAPDPAPTNAQLIFWNTPQADLVSQHDCGYSFHCVSYS